MYAHLTKIIIVLLFAVVSATSVFAIKQELINIEQEPINIDQKQINNDMNSGRYRNAITSLQEVRREDLVMQEFFKKQGEILKKYRENLKSLKTVDNSVVSVNVSDSLALVEFYYKTNGSQWNNNNNWLSGPVATWFGVTARFGSVTELILPDNNLQGCLPPELGQISGLILLSLEHNKLSGEIPKELGLLSNLLLISFWDNNLTGGIPPELGNLSNLILLYLTHNEFSGTIPREMGGLSNLLLISFWNNNLMGEIPPELGQLSKLELLSLSENRISGEVPPELGQLSKLVLLYLEFNDLSGAIPRELADLANLQVLSLSNNKIDGGIPGELGMLSNLYELYLWNNKLIGGIPKELGQLSNLTSLYLDLNKLSGQIPQEIGMLSNLQELGLSGNCLYGNIPPVITSLNNLNSEWTSISYNMLKAVDPGVITFLDYYFEDWQLTQTIAPEFVSVSQVTDQLVKVTWEPIEYTNDSGFYIIRYGTDRGNLSDSLATNNKSTSAIYIEKNDSQNEYYFAVQTRTNPHAYNFNTLISPTSKIVDEKGDVSSEFDSTDLPIDFELHQNYPNPFNPTTHIGFTIPEQVHVRLEVFNSLGQCVAVLVNEIKSAGRHEITFNADNLSSGLYLYRLQTDSHTEIRLMLLMK